MRAVVALSAVILLAVICSGQKRGGGGGRRRTSIKNPMLTKMLTDSNSRSEYYSNPNGARILKSSHFDFEYILGHKVLFLCEAKGDPLPQITWYKDGMELYYHPYLQIHEWKIGNDTIKSKMEIDPTTQMDAGTYECHANNKYAIDRKAFKADFFSET
jgi:hypothetical protein